MPEAAVMSVNFTNGISVLGCSGTTGALRLVNFVVCDAGLRCAYQIALPAMLPNITNATTDQRKARPITASSKWADSSSGTVSGRLVAPGRESLSVFWFINFRGQDWSRLWAQAFVMRLANLTPRN